MRKQSNSNSILSSTASKVRYGNAYIVPFIKDEDNIRVLVGQKQVISYTAIANLKLNEQVLEALRQLIKSGECPIESDGKVNIRRSKLGKRFDGALLPAGGKACFFGGRIERDKKTKQYETPKRAAIREFEEELHLKNCSIAENQLEELLSTSWGGIYYKLDISSLPISVEEINRVISTFEQQLISLRDIYDGRVKTKDETFPELHKIKSLPLDTELKDLINKIDVDFIKGEIRRFSEFMYTLIGEPLDNIEKFVNSLTEHFVENEPIDSHIKAVEELECQFVVNDRTISNN